MNIDKVKNELKRLYPGKNIIVTDQKNPGEIICEIEPTENHPDWSEAVAVIDFTRLHFHKKLTEVYEVIKGKLQLTVNGVQKNVKEGDKITLVPLTKHSAKGNETWIKVTSKPGWTPDDHILVFDKTEISRKEFDTK